MPSTILYISATLFLSLNSFRLMGIPVSDWLFLGSFISAVFETLRAKQTFFSTWMPRSFFLWSAMLVILGALFSSSNTKDQSVASIEVLQTLYVITIFISLTWIMVKRGKAEIIVTAFIITGVFTSVIAIIDYLSGTNYGQLLSDTPNIIYIGRYAGTLGYPNKFGYFLVLTTILAFYKLIVSIQKKKNIVIIFIVLIGILSQGMGVYLSGSIAAYLGLLVGLLCLCYVAIHPKIRLAVNIFGFLTIIASLIIVIIGIQNIIGPRLEIPETSLIGIGINRVINITAGSRIDLYIQAMDYIIKSPFIGAGFDQNASSTLLDIEKSFAGSIHNPFIQMWYMGGFLAFLGWVSLHLFIGKIAVVDLNNQINNPIILRCVLSAIIIGTLVMDMFTNAIYQREKWLVVGLLVGSVWSPQQVEK